MKLLDQGFRCFRSGHLNGVNLLVFVAIIVISLTSILLRIDVPLVAISDAGHDDGLFARLANSIARGRWLGGYDNLTLSKGPMFPAFLALTSVIGIPLKLAEHALYLFAVGAFVYVLWRLTGKRLFAFCLYAALAFNPVLWTSAAQRVTRDNVYTSLSLLLFAVVVWLLFCHSSENFKRRLCVAVFSGAVAAVFWLTREEGVWLIPALVLLFAVKLLQSVSQVESNPFRSADVRRRMIKLVGLGVVSFVSVYMLVVVINFWCYGVATINDFRDGNFSRAYGAIQRIRTDDWQRYIHYSAETEKALFTHSPTARQLKPFLSAEKSNWRKVGCDDFKWEPCPVGIAGGWFVWALRDAAANAGYFGSAREARAFFGSIADELNSACDSGTLSCFAERAGMMPPYREEFLLPFIDSITETSKRLLQFGAGELGWIPPSGSNAEMAFFRKVVGRLPQMEDSMGPAIRIAGWAGSASALNFAVLDGVGETAEVIVDQNEAPAIGLHLQKEEGWPADTNAIRFNLKTSCSQVDCKLVPNFIHESDKSIDLGVIEVPGAVRVGSSIVYFSSIVNESQMFEFLEPTEVNSHLAMLGKWSYQFSALAQILVWFVPLAALIALLNAFRDMENLGLFAVFVSAGAAVCSRIGVVAIINTTAWRSINVSYLMPSTTFAIIVLALSLYFVCSGLACYYKRFSALALQV